MAVEYTKNIVSPEFPNGKVVEMTSEEKAQLDADIAQGQIDMQNAYDYKVKIANDKANGNQKLLDLGLTQDEATALTGYKPPVE